MTDRSIRASDTERESVVDILRDAYTDGRLVLDEFEQRTSAAYAAKTWGDLRELTADLPVQPAFGVDLSGVPLTMPARQLTGSAAPATTSAHLPQRPPAPVDRSYESRRDRPIGRLLPVMVAWILIAAAAGSPVAVVVLLVVFGFLIACRVGCGGRG
jgi:Domain of unknown function (DUF1707)